MSESVPFGKYKGRPVEEMQADTEYMAWLEGQPWFRERFAKLAVRTPDEMSRTPEHNRIQAVFLDFEFVRAFVAVTNDPAIEKERKAGASFWAEEIANKRKEIESFTWNGRDVTNLNAELGELLSPENHNVSIWAEFEERGADVMVLIGFKHYGFNNRNSRYGRAVVELPVEVKPVVSDDYPAVLRQMKRNGSRYLLVGRYEGVGATVAQFKEIFSRSGKTVVFLSDVEARKGT